MSKITARDTSILQQVAAAWTRALRGQSGKGAFFDLGGDSLDAVRLVVELESILGTRIPFSLLLTPEGLDGLLAWVREQERG